MRMVIMSSSPDLSVNLLIYRIMTQGMAQWFGVHYNQEVL